LLKQIDECNKIVESLPGANYSQEEKMKMFIESKEKLELKWYAISFFCSPIVFVSDDCSQLIEKYRDFPLFSMESHLCGSIADIVIPPPRVSEKSVSSGIGASDVIVKDEEKEEDLAMEVESSNSMTNNSNNSNNNNNNIGGEVVESISNAQIVSTPAPTARKKLILKKPTK
jgi:hypothetical protein